MDALRRSADIVRPEAEAAPSHATHHPTSLRIVVPHAGAMRLARQPRDIARILRHGPRDAVRPSPAVRHPSIEALFARARSLWPGLDPKALARTRGDVRRIARLVGRRTALPEDTIVAMLLAAR